jgi:extracellular elastinolytic metalloproteinase
MPNSRLRRRARALALLGAVTIVGALATSVPAVAGSSGPRSMAPNRSVLAHTPALYDSRVAPTALVPPSASRSQAALARDLGSQGVLELDPSTGSPRMVARLDGFLTRPSTGTPEDVALGYVEAHRDAFGLSVSDVAGLRLVRDYVDILGTHHLTWVQTVDGVPSWDHDLRAHVTADGRLIAITGSPSPGLSVPSVRPELEPKQAVASAYRAVGEGATAVGGQRRVSTGPTLNTTFASGEDARLVLFDTARGTRLAWRTTTFVAADEVDVSIVDDVTRQVLWRVNVTRSDATGTGQAWPAYPGANVPNAGGQQRPVTFPVENGNALRGNNAWAYPDTNDDDRPDGQVPASSGLEWDYPASLETSDPSQNCSPSYPCSWDAGVPFSWQTNEAQSTTQVFAFLNAFHDHLLAAPIGFTEAAGNFQTVNASGQGSGGDAVVANVLDGANTANTPGLPDRDHVINANMATLPDGEPPKMQMYLFPATQLGTPSANGGDDASVVYHEYTHGLSSRLVTLPDGTEALNSAQAGAMGEAWSDFYALDFLVQEGYLVDGPGPDVFVGPYVGGGVPDLLRFEATDCPVGSSGALCAGGSSTGRGGFTYGDFGHVYLGPEVHSDGEIWGQTLWDLRDALGSDKTLMLLTRAMELSPPEPSFLDERNAILMADEVAFGGADQDEIWDVFAHRGMGFFAEATDGSDTRPGEDFSLPPTCPGNCGTISGTVVDRETGKPIQGLRVAIAGHASGLLNDLADTTDASGSFSIDEVPFHGYTVTAFSPKHEPFARSVNVDGDERVRIRLERDWASTGGGARLVSATKPNYSDYGCGPGLAFDASLGTGWGSDSPDNSDSGVTGPRTAVVRLPKAIDVSSFGFATGGTCGDGPTAAVRAFSISTKTKHGRWIRAFDNDGRLRVGVLLTLRPHAGARNVRFVKITMRSSSGDPAFMDMLELSVRGTP